MSDLALPGDWAAAVFGRDDIRDYPESHDGEAHLSVGPNFVRQPGAGPEVDITPAPIWRTRGAQWVDIVFGRGSLPGLTPEWFRARRHREGELLPAPLAFLDAVTLPGDFSSDELAAQAEAQAAFVGGRLIRNRTGAVSKSPFWFDRFKLPEVVRRHSWDDLHRANNPIAILVSLRSTGELSIDRGSMTILAAARASSLAEIPTRVVYV